MELLPTNIAEVKLMRPKVHDDSRGHFYESYNETLFRKLGLPTYFAQDNHSFSTKNILRGLHLQLPPHEQGKLVRVVKGAVLDVAVDIRKNSPTFGSYFSTILSDENKHIMFVPEGFAHGFYTLSDEAVFLYKCTAYYNRLHERSIIWNDPDLNIDWGTVAPALSEKDTAARPFKEILKEL